MDKDGSNAGSIFTDAETRTFLVDDTSIVYATCPYVAGTGSVSRILKGTSQSTVLGVTQCGAVASIGPRLALAPGKVVWWDPTPSALHVVAETGGNVTTFPLAIVRATGLAIDGGYVYYAWGGVGTAAGGGRSCVPGERRRGAARRRGRRRVARGRRHARLLRGLQAAAR